MLTWLRLTSSSRNSRPCVFLVRAGHKDIWKGEVKLQLYYSYAGRSVERPMGQLTPSVVYLPAHRVGVCSCSVSRTSCFSLLWYLDQGCVFSSKMKSARSPRVSVGSISSSRTQLVPFPVLQPFTFFPFCPWPCGQKVKHCLTSC